MKRIKVIYRKIRDAYGWSHGKGFIEVDERLKGKKQLEIIIHECIHELFPNADEEEVEKKAATLTRTLWHEGYRKIDNTDKIKLQDEYTKKK